jgi:PKD repeat protein
MWWNILDKPLFRHYHGTITSLFLVFLVCAVIGMLPVSAANTTQTVSPTQTSTQVTTAATTSVPSTTHTSIPATSVTTTAATTQNTIPVTSQTTTAVTTDVPTQVNPVIAFYAEPLDGSAPLEVQFTDMSTGGPTSWSWDFGDGTSDTIKSPTHTYQDAGTYTVRLTATTRTGSASSTREDYITVESAVTTTATTTTTTTGTTTATTGSSSLLADFTGSPRSGNTPLTVVFSDTTVGTPISWLWDFGDGITDTTQNPVHMYTEVGTYTVSLTVNSSGSGKKVKKADFITATSSSDTTLPERTLPGSGGGGSQVRTSVTTGASSDQNSAQSGTGITKTPVPTLTGKAWLEYEKQRMAEVDAIVATQQNKDVISLLLNFFKGLIPWI